jgi:hypothetical protein
MTEQFCRSPLILCRPLALEFLASATPDCGCRFIRGYALMSNTWTKTIADEAQGKSDQTLYPLSEPEHLHSSVNLFVSGVMENC